MATIYIFKQKPIILFIVVAIIIFCSCNRINQLNKQIKANNDTIEVYKERLDSNMKRMDNNIHKLDSIISTESK